MWLILAGLLVLISWALWFILPNQSWIWPVVTTGVIAVLYGSIELYRFIRARRAAARLEKEIVEQGARQAMNARPERRAEIQELQRQLQGGIQALKSSKLGRSGKSGAAALYSMPWYMIIGPPGAGKTTALKHSGLVFPFGSNSIRGVGGTRNCDWWFTNEAILLDTAGRYTTQQDDRDEWFSFLQFLLRYRSKRPINGIIVALSITDLIDASEQQIEVMGKTLRARIDEVMSQLSMVLPVYVLFTKIDLIAGFSEFFGDLRKSDRAQAWGATLRLDVPKNEPARLFDAEFDVLLKQLHARTLKRLATERSREAREKIYQFPLEFAAIKRNLAELLASTFAVNSFQGTPLFRGVYFTSGTQEGRPLDRVLGRMSAAMGIRQEAQQAQQAQVESKSYFLHDVFMHVVFPDGNLASRSAAEIRRRLILRAAISGAALCLAAILAIPSISSFSNNRTLLRDTLEKAQVSALANWEDKKPLESKLPLLLPTLERLKELDVHKAEGVPWNLRWWMYMGDRVYRPTMTVYVSAMQRAFVVPAKQQLEALLKDVSTEPSKYTQTRTTLRMYLMLADPDHLEVEWATGRYVKLWSSLAKGSTDLPEVKLREQMRPHVEYYFDLVKKGKVTPLSLDKDLIAKVRETLQKVPVNKRFYAEFVEYQLEEKYDEAGDDSAGNLVFPPVSLATIFANTPEVLTVVESEVKNKTQQYFQVTGPYTDKGYYFVVKAIASGAKFLETEAWVIPLTRDEMGDKLAVNLKTVGDVYEQEYMKAWELFLNDVRVRKPTTTDEAINIYRILSAQPDPLRKIVQRVEDNTQWTNLDTWIKSNNAVRSQINMKLNQRFSTASGGLNANIDIRRIGDKTSVIPTKFKQVVEYGSAHSGKTTAGFAYTEILDRLENKLVQAKRNNPGVDLRTFNPELDAAELECETLLKKFDDFSRGLLLPIMQMPLKAGDRNAPGAIQIGGIQAGQQPGMINAPKPVVSSLVPSTWTMPSPPGRAPPPPTR